MPLETITRLPPDQCPACEGPVDAHTAVEDGTKPKPGDFSVCINCAGILRYDEGLRLVIPENGWQKEVGKKTVRELAKMKMAVVLSMLSAGRRPRKQIRPA